MMTCVNRNCNLPISTFSDGRLFHFEILSISVAADDTKKSAVDEVPQRQGVHFWLCGACAANMTLVLEPVDGLQLIPVGRSPEDRLSEDRSPEDHSIECRPLDPAFEPTLETTINLVGGHSPEPSMKLCGAFHPV